MPENLSDPQQIVVAGIQGRNGASPIFTLRDDECREALNVDWFESSFARKRGGASALSMSGGTAFTGIISTLGWYQPSVDQGARELWAVDDAATPAWKRLAGGTSWADVTVGDACQTRPMDINLVTFDGKLFAAYNSSVNRLHLWDGTSFRRAGLDKASVPSLSNTGSGTYAAIIRYYKVRWVTIVSSVITIQGELSAAVEFTPSGSGTHARVTAPSAPGEAETHWEVYGSPDGANYFRLAQVVEATTTYDDNTDPSAYSGTIPPDVNACIAPPSAKYLCADLKRLVMGGAWETAAGNSMTPKSNRFWWTAPLGATDQGDAERVQNTSTIKNYDDVDEDLTGIGGPINGSVFLFSYGGAWKAVNTGVPDAPYVTVKIAGALGCISHKSIVTAEDENGETALYWLSPVGPVRFGARGFQRCHEDVDDIWRNVNLSASNVVAHGIYHRDKHQIWWWVATGAANDPDQRIVFDVRLGKIVRSETASIESIRRGWAKHTGESCEARCSILFSDTVAASMSRTMKPYIGYTGANGTIWKCDSGTDDAGTDFQSYILTKPYQPWGPNRLGAMTENAMLVAGASSGVTIQLSVIRGLGQETRTSSALLTATGSETHVFRKFDESVIAQATSIQFKIGDSAAADASWNLDLMFAPWKDDGPFQSF